MLVVLGSLAGAPGVSTLAMALAASWPDTDPVLVEADVSGGDIAAWRSLNTEVGVVSLAARARTLTPLTARSEETLTGHSQQVEGGLRVVAAPSGPHQTETAVRMLTQHTEVLRHSGGPTVVDVGRMMPGSAGTHLAAQADAVVVATRADAAQLRRVRDCAEVFAALPERGVRVGLALVGTGFTAAEVAAETGLEVWARIPRDARSAAFIHGERTGIAPRRRPLMRAARSLAADLADGHRSHQETVRRLIAAGGKEET